MEKKVFINIEDSHSGHDDSYSSQTSTQGVLRLLGHIVDVAQDVYLVSAFIGTDVGIRAQLTYPVDVKAFELVLVPDD